MVYRNVPVNTPLLGGAELAYLTECIRTGWISSEGPFVAKFEEAMAGISLRQYGIAVANGSAALDIAVAALGLSQGDEVILPAHTIISCAAAIVRSGAKPVLVDSDPITWNMDADKIEEKITDKTKAIMAVHLYGLPVDCDKIIEVGKRHGLYIIEDAAQMHGQTYRGKPCGSFGDISTFSFYPNKLITAGEGGMCLTDDPRLADRCRGFRNLCFQKEKRFVHEELGWNYRMTSLQAAVGLAQAEDLPAHVKKKRSIGEAYLKGFSGLGAIQLPLEKTDFAHSIFWVFGLVLNDDTSYKDNYEVMKILADKGVGTRPFFWSMHEQPVFRKMGLFQGESYPVSERLSRMGFYIPSGLGMSEEDIEFVISTIGEIF